MRMSLMDRFRLDGRVVVVTGASSGLGAGFARAAAEAGASVVVAARRVERLEQVSREIEERGTAVLAHGTDVTDPRACAELVEAAITRFGRLDVLINNAGVASGVPALKEEPDDFRKVVDVNLNGTYWMARECARVMERGSTIVNVASMHAFIGSRFPQASYTASKSGVVGLTRDLAQQWSGRRGIRVNALCPGYFASEMTEQGASALQQMVSERSILGRFGTQEEIDTAMLFLASDASAYMTGGSLVIDGGFTAF